MADAPMRTQYLGVREPVCDRSDQDYRRALGCFPTGVAVLAARMEDDTPSGLTINSFTSVSLSPRLVAWGLNRHRESAARFIDRSYLAVNILSASQAHLAMRFSSPERTRFDDLAWLPGLGGSPVLAGVCASFEIRVTARHEEGDHMLCLGQVLRFHQWEHAPLMFVAGKLVPQPT